MALGRERPFWHGSAAALTGLDLRIEPGEAYWHLGPNGAGKTTTIRLSGDHIVGCGPSRMGVPGAVHSVRPR